MPLVLLSGPSGVGKDSVIQAWKNINDSVREIITYTTREPRPSELNGDDYYFVDPEVFDRLIEDSFFADYRKIFGSYYGIAEQDLERACSSDKIFIANLDVDGVRNIYSSYRSSLKIFILPPSLEDLERRLSKRDDDFLSKRLTRAEREISLADTYDYQVRNINVYGTARRLDKIVAMEKFSRHTE